MRFSTTLSFLVAISLSASSFAFGAPVPRGKTVSARPDVRKLQFPNEYPAGKLKLMGVERINTDNMGNGIGPAQGNITIAVPPDKTILLELNPHMIEHPERLKTLNLSGIDRLKLSYMAMEDNEHFICDAAITALPECKDLFALYVDRSDVTDKGLSGFKSLSNIKYLYCSGAGIEGWVFKDPKKFKSLERVNLIFNPLKFENLKYLSALPRLNEVILNQSSISDNDLTNLAKCTQLKGLHLSDNIKITDKSLPLLRSFKNLEELNVRGTGISFEGLLTLKELKLKRLWISVRRYRQPELDQLAKAFPKAYIDYRGAGVGEENRVYFAPLK